MHEIVLDENCIKTIRERVKNGETKIEVANKLGISYYTVKKYTRDIPTILRIPVELEQRIREEVKKGKSTWQVAEGFPQTVKFSFTTKNLEESSEGGTPGFELWTFVIAGLLVFSIVYIFRRRK